MMDQNDARELQSSITRLSGFLYSLKGYSQQNTSQNLRSNFVRILDEMKAGGALLNSIIKRQPYTNNSAYKPNNYSPVEDHIIASNLLLTSVLLMSESIVELVTFMNGSRNVPIGKTHITRMTSFFSSFFTQIFSYLNLVTGFIGDDMAQWDDTISGNILEGVATVKTIIEGLKEYETQLKSLSIIPDPIELDGEAYHSALDLFVLPQLKQTGRQISEAMGVFAGVLEQLGVSSPNDAAPDVDWDSAGNRQG